MNETHAAYLRYSLDPIELKLLVKEVSDCINKRFPNVDYIAGTGISGLSVLSAISYETGKHMFIVRKKQDTDNHSIESFTSCETRKCEYIRVSKIGPSALIIDDLASSGDTLQRMISIIEGEGITISGIILYFKVMDDENGKIQLPNGMYVDVVYPCKHDDIYSKYY